MGTSAMTRFQEIPWRSYLSGTSVIILNQIQVLHLQQAVTLFTYHGNNKQLMAPNSTPCRYVLARVYIYTAAVILFLRSSRLVANGGTKHGL
jgi:hypothetical protein